MTTCRVSPGREPHDPLLPYKPADHLWWGSQSEPINVGDLAEEELDPKSVVVDDPIVGEGITTLDEHGPGAWSFGAQNHCSSQGDDTIGAVEAFCQWALAI